MVDGPPGDHRYTPATVKKLPLREASRHAGRLDFYTYSNYGAR
jgi:hypothetical protein